MDQPKSNFTLLDHLKKFDGITFDYTNRLLHAVSVGNTVLETYREEEARNLALLVPLLMQISNEIDANVLDPLEGLNNLVASIASYVQVRTGKIQNSRESCVEELAYTESSEYQYRGNKLH